MAIKDKIISDIELELTRGKPSDDLEIGREQIDYWISIERDRIVRDYLERYKRDSGELDPFYITRTECLDVSLYNINCPYGDCPKEITATIPFDVLSLSGDDGIETVRLNNGRNVARVDLNDLEIIDAMRFSKPSINNPVYYRNGRQLYFRGLPEKFIRKGKITIFAVKSIEGETILDTDEFPISEDLIPTLTDDVLERGLRELTAQFEDLHNDGTQA